MDENKTRQEELIEKAKELAEGSLENISNLSAKAADLKKMWRRTINGEADSLFDKEMSEIFYGYMDKVSAREAEAHAAVVAKKEEIIADAKKVLEEPNFKKASAMMDELLERWKAAGRTNSKETDDELWDKFRTVRKEFFEKKTAFFEGMRKKFAESKAIKEELIEKAKEANKLESFKEIGAIMADLMNQWKAAGNAGKDHEEKLWEAFNAERKAFYDRKDAYFKALKERRNNQDAE